MRAQLPLRFARTAAFAAVCVALAAFAHVLGGGSVPAPWAAALGLAGVSLLGLALCGRERSAGTINLTLVGAQIGLHELFAGEGASYVSVHGHAQGGLAVNAGMLLTHLTATVITGLWLARGEAALWSVLHRLGRRLTLLVPPAPPVRPQCAPPVVTRVIPLCPAFRHSVARRGPPLPA
ncbi:MFS transporter [Nonomuraea sp. NPDC049421]|uniref:MFS transporter n=1 Tax=Nonomuraea sp. NPDC049421 TaxID=3155275 RepID=UPI003423527D